MQTLEYLTSFLLFYLVIPFYPLFYYCITKYNFWNLFNYSCTKGNMKAFVTKPGGLGIFVTGEYKTLKNLIRYGVKPYIKETVNVEVYHNWDNRYGAPDKVVEVTAVLG